MFLKIAVRCRDITEVPCDIAVFKYAQGFYGAEQTVVEALGLKEDEFSLPPGCHRFIPTGGRLPCRVVMFIGVEDPYNFGYAEIREFASSALKLIASAQEPKSIVAMTMHGIGFGLDMREAATAQIAGLLEYIDQSRGWKPEQLLLVERDSNRAQRLAAILDGILAATGVVGAPGEQQRPKANLPDAGRTSDAKKHVFVAMPYDESMEDVYEFGIREPVNECQYLCERCDRDVFTGDVLERIRKRIADATLVIADMSGANPNVYLEVGYAWGKGVPTLLIAREGEDLTFDVRAQKCVFYKNIMHLRRQLTTVLSKLPGVPDV